MNSQWESDSSSDSVGRTGGGAPGAHLLPIIRAAMARGEGPPAVVAWLRNHGQAILRRIGWSSADESQARAFAQRLAATLGNRARANRPTELLLGDTR